MMTSAILLALACAQGPEVKLSAELKEVPGDAKKAPLFLAEGATDLPDGAILKVGLYIGPVSPGDEAQRGLVQVKDGKFAKDFQIFGPRERALAGTDRLRVAIDPNLQPPKLQSLPPRHVDVKLEVGDGLAREKEHAAVRKQLEGEIRAILAIAGEVQEKFAAAKEKPEVKAWAALTEDWKRRCQEIERRAGLVSEYRHLGYVHIVDSGLEQLREITLNMAGCGARGLAAPMQEGRVVLDRTAQTLLGELNAAALSPLQLRALVEDFRSVLKESTTIPAEGVPAARRKYVALSFSLGRHLGDKHADALGALADGGKRLFDALDEKKTDEAKALQAELLQRTDRLLQALQDPK
jgi:hypothetical protein